MKAAILAGGYGTRLPAETRALPKPMAEIGGKPILWHIMKYDSAFGCKAFVIRLGCKSCIIFGAIDFDAGKTVTSEALVADGKLGVYTRGGFWQYMDTQRDKSALENLWDGGDGPWRVWEER